MPNPNIVCEVCSVNSLSNNKINGNKNKIKLVNINLTLIFLKFTLLNNNP